MRASVAEQDLDSVLSGAGRAEIESRGRTRMQAVLDASNALMAEAPRQFRKQLLSSRGTGPTPLYVTTDDLASQEAEKKAA